MKKRIIIFSVAAILLLATFVIGSGFLKVGTVYVQDVSVSEDGQEITVEIENASSAGAVRKAVIRQQEGGKLYVDFYAAFGGINGTLGAQTAFTFPLKEDTAVIGFYRSPNAYEVVLQKNADGNWALAEKSRRLTTETSPLDRPMATMEAYESAYVGQSVIEKYRFLNGEAWSRLNQDVYMQINAIGTKHPYAGAEMVAKWYERNLKIFANIQRLAADKERIFVLYGAGHLQILRDLIRADSHLRLSDVMAYL